MATRFIWIPGMRPVKVPVRIPRRNGIIRESMIIFLQLFVFCFYMCLVCLGKIFCRFLIN